MFWAVYNAVVKKSELHSPGIYQVKDEKKKKIYANLCHQVGKKETMRESDELLWEAGT